MHSKHLAENVVRGSCVVPVGSPRGGIAVVLYGIVIRGEVVVEGRVGRTVRL